MLGLPAWPRPRSTAAAWIAQAHKSPVELFSDSLRAAHSVLTGPLASLSRRKTDAPLGLGPKWSHDFCWTYPHRSPQASVITPFLTLVRLAAYLGLASPVPAFQLFNLYIIFGCCTNTVLSRWVAPPEYLNVVIVPACPNHKALLEGHFLKIILTRLKHSKVVFSRLLKAWD